MRRFKSFLPIAALALWPSLSAAQILRARVVHYRPDEIVPIYAKLRYTTAIILPANEHILDFVTGDKTYWIINGRNNYCFLHPAAAGISSDLDLITKQGHVYSFTLQEISKLPEKQPDLEVFIRPRDPSLIKPADPDPPSAVPAKAKLQAYRLQAQLAEREARQQMLHFEANYPLKLKFGYKFKRGKRPFYIEEIYNDGRFTYIRSHAHTAPALYAISDGQPGLVNFQVRDGVYIVSRVLDAGYLKIGHKKLKFRLRHKG